MKQRIYLVITPTRIRDMTHSKPALRSGEVTLALDIEIDDAFFDTPALHLNVAVGEEHLLRMKKKAGLKVGPVSLPPVEPETAKSSEKTVEEQP